MCKFSVIVTAYNIEAFLPHCLDSLLDQTFSDYEIIVVNDGSTDLTSSICLDYSKRSDKITVITTENQGVVTARFNGACASKGEYIVFVDGDDYVKKSFLFDFNQAIAGFKPDIVCSNYYICNCKKEFQQSFPISYGFYNKTNITNTIFPILIQSENGMAFPPSLWGKAFKRDIYLKHQFIDSKASIGEDGAGTIACVFNSESLFFVENHLYVYRINANSITRSKKVFSWETVPSILNHFSIHIECEEDNIRQQIDRFTVRLLFSIAVSCFHSNKRYGLVKKEISEKLDEYKDVINRAHFKKSFKCRLISWVLKHRSYFLIKVFSFIK